MNDMANARKIALKALMEVRQNNAYSNITLNNAFKDIDILPADKALATAIFYGVLDRTITLDYILSRFIKTPLKKVSPITLEVLRTALYQIMFMDKIPHSAAVNEAVRLIKSSKERYNASFINGVLRNILRSEIDLPNDDNVESLSVRYSCPRWIVESFLCDYGLDNVKQLLEHSLQNPPVSLRVNTLKTDEQALINALQQDGFCAQKGALDNSLSVSGGINVSKNSHYLDGMFHIQDISSQTAVKIFSPKKGERILDVCAAPGGKTFTVAEYLENCGEVVSCDLYEQRVNLIKKGADRLGINIISPVVADATTHNDDFGEFDAILCDVPCSGLGVIRRKPEIKYKSIDEYQDICDIQAKILENAANYLKDNGRILYSTCTLRKCENEAVVYAFLDKHSGYELKYEHTFMPHIDGTDGFYCALLQKAGD